MIAVLIIAGNPEHHFLGFFIGHYVSDGARFFGPLAPMLRVVDGNFWLLLLLLPLQPTFGTSRQFLIVVSNPKHPTL